MEPNTIIPQKNEIIGNDIYTQKLCLKLVILDFASKFNESFLNDSSCIPFLNSLSFSKINQINKRICCLKESVLKEIYNIRLKKFAEIFLYTIFKNLNSEKCKDLTTSTFYNNLALEYSSLNTLDLEKNKNSLPSYYKSKLIKFFTNINLSKCENSTSSKNISNWLQIFSFCQISSVLILIYNSQDSCKDNELITIQIELIVENCSKILFNLYQIYEFKEFETIYLYCNVIIVNENSQIEQTPTKSEQKQALPRVDVYSISTNTDTWSLVDDGNGNGRMTLSMESDSISCRECECGNMTENSGNEASNYAENHRISENYDKLIELNEEIGEINELPVFGRNFGKFETTSSTSTLQLTSKNSQKYLTSYSSIDILSESESQSTIKYNMTETSNNTTLDNFSPTSPVVFVDKQNNLETTINIEIDTPQEHSEFIEMRKTSSQNLLKQSTTDVELHSNISSEDVEKLIKAASSNCLLEENTEFSNDFPSDYPQLEHIEEHLSLEIDSKNGNSSCFENIEEIQEIQEIRETRETHENILNPASLSEQVEELKASEKNSELQPNQYDRNTSMGSSCPSYNYISSTDIDITMTSSNRTDNNTPPLALYNSLVLENNMNFNESSENTVNLPSSMNEILENDLKLQNSKEIKGNVERKSAVNQENYKSVEVKQDQKKEAINLIRVATISAAVAGLAYFTIKKLN